MNKYEIVKHEDVMRGDTLSVLNLKTGVFTENLKATYVSIYKDCGISFATNSGKDFVVNRTGQGDVVLLRQNRTANVPEYWPPREGDVWKFTDEEFEYHVHDGHMYSNIPGDKQKLDGFIRGVESGKYKMVLVHRLGHKLGSK